jgi:WhiB family redox-sensing transcriptional regulator
MSVLFSDLLLPGWAQGDGAMTGLGEVTTLTGTGDEFALPCHSSDPELFFSEDSTQVTVAKQLCGTCPMVQACLEGALSRAEPCGVWGGQLFDGGLVIAAKRGVGRPRTRTLGESSRSVSQDRELVRAS